MNYSYELFSIENGFGYNILCDGSIIITQEYDPNLSGYSIMTEEYAKEQAEIVLKRLEV